MKKNLKLKGIVMLTILAIISLINGCSGNKQEWKTIPNDKVDESGKVLKIINEENKKTISTDLIYKNPKTLDDVRIQYMPLEYTINDIGNGKESIKNVEAQKEVIVNKDKFGDDEEVKTALTSGKSAYILDDYIVVFINNPNYKKGDKDTALYNGIKWYDLKSEKWSNIDISKYPYLTSVVLNLNNNELFILGYDVKNENQRDITEKIYSLNLKNAEIKDESNLSVSAGTYLEYEYLNANKMIFANTPNENTVIRIIDFKNKVFSELINEKLALIDNSMYNFEKTLAPSKDRLFYETEKDGVVSVHVLLWGKDDKVKADEKVYEYKKGKYVNINWSNDSKKLVIGEDIDSNGTPQNYKILEFNM